MVPQIRHILIADDDALLLRTLQLSLTGAGFTVGTAQDGAEALAYIRKHQPEAAVLDVFMPETDGFEVLRIVKQELPQVRIFFMSGGGFHERFDALQMTAKLGADGVLQKPFTGSQLISLITDAPVASQAV